MARQEVQVVKTGNDFIDKHQESVFWLVDQWLQAGEVVEFTDPDDGTDKEITRDELLGIIIKAIAGFQAKATACGVTEHNRAIRSIDLLGEEVLKLKAVA